MGLCTQALGDLGAAADHWERALAILRPALGEEHRDVARACNNYAWNEVMRGRLDHAEALYECARRAHAASGNRHFEAVAVAGLGEVACRRGRVDDGIARFREALAIYEEVLSPEHRSIETLTFQLGNALRLAGRLEEAEAQYRRSIAIGEGLTGMSFTALALYAVALGRLDRGDAAEATALLERALAIYPHVESRPAPLVAATMKLHLARALHARGDRERALSIGREARAELAAEGADPALLADVDAWLARPSLGSRTSRRGEARTPGMWPIRW
jgi:tetratricopeptide (TPR) repeat protein